ncbi:MAG: carbohydrate kinase [Bacteroidetes bacterium 24-39-8]|jgi:xylulokinase|nr:MAG: carbohydrate kinase [Bacteroidetes bacterium 24-39-8]OZA65436.1 MAG: carbohydrate kinase [Sphingobacteriia bacterium 39-39-8]HQR92849.1 FGGY family carbohydrate kinase [Sediminibacterium sp.]HQS55250.1 FGGY family carbohydrate kinase [Sediminibacterium sp.]
MLLLGLDIGTSSIKVAIVDAQTQQTIVTVQYPDSETPIKSLQKGWAEQSPKDWWEHAKLAILKAHATQLYQPSEIVAIGIAYQMHGLVCIDKQGHLLRDSIIWCDSRAVELGNQAFDSIGHEQALSHLLNSPGNFTASKLAWVKQNEPEVYNKIAQVMLPGDFIALQLTGNANTSISSLSEGIFWDFQTKSLSEEVFQYYGLDKNHIPAIQNVFSEHGLVSASVAAELGLKAGIPVTYKAGDQPNNALSLNVLEPGEVAATAGTSGVIYGVTDQLRYDQKSRVNSFAHVNHTSTDPRIGVLLCINGTGILNSWIKQIAGAGLSYAAMNQAAASITAGADGLYLLPFGNGAERMLENKTIDAHMSHINLNKHSAAHLFRAAQEGIAFAFRYGLDIMRSNGMQPAVIRAGKANMFLSNVFAKAFVNTTNTKVELHDCDGSVGAAIGAGIGSGIYQNAQEAFSLKKALETIEPDQASTYDQLYGEWLQVLNKQMN